jgi:hypothetical protein
MKFIAFELMEWSCTVVDVVNNRVKINYDQLTAGWDEWLPAESERIKRQLHQ